MPIMFEFYFGVSFKVDDAFKISKLIRFESLRFPRRFLYASSSSLLLYSADTPDFPERNEVKNTTAFHCVKIN